MIIPYFLFHANNIGRGLVSIPATGSGVQHEPCEHMTTHIPTQRVELYGGLVTDDYLVNCPHCKEWLVVAHRDIHCGIFRHAVYKHTFQAVPPHLTQEECAELKRTDRVYGCCMPFRLIFHEGTKPPAVHACGYI